MHVLGHAHSALGLTTCSRGKLNNQTKRNYFYHSNLIIVGVLYIIFYSYFVLQSTYSYFVPDKDPFHMRANFSTKSKFLHQIQLFWNCKIPDSIETSKSNFKSTVRGVPMPAKRNFEVSKKQNRSFSNHQKYQNL